LTTWTFVMRVFHSLMCRFGQQRSNLS